MGVASGYFGSHGSSHSRTCSNYHDSFSCKFVAHLFSLYESIFKHIYISSLSTVRVCALIIEYLL